MSVTESKQRFVENELATFAISFGRSLTSLGPVERLRRLRREIPGRIIFTTSFGLEDQVITHLIADGECDIEIVTLDTGRLFAETYALWQLTEQRYGRRIASVYPMSRDLEALIRQQGINGFYDSVEARKACCHVRKVAPLGRAILGAQAWITGMRADQSASRGGIRLADFDADRQLLKVNPLFDWSRQAVLEFARQWDVPLNPLHDAGFVSIGCAPCTRAVQQGEPERAGRWWWELESSKECGLHLNRPTATTFAAIGL